MSTIGYRYNGHNNDSVLRYKKTWRSGMRKSGKREGVKSSGVATVGAVIALFGFISAVVGIFEFAGSKQSLRYDGTIGVLAISLGVVAVLFGILMIGIGDIVVELRRLRLLNEVAFFDDLDDTRER